MDHPARLKRSAEQDLVPIPRQRAVVPAVPLLPYGAPYRAAEYARANRLPRLRYHPRGVIALARQWPDLPADEGRPEWSEIWNAIAFATARGLPQDWIEDALSRTGPMLVIQDMCRAHGRGTPSLEEFWAAEFLDVAQRLDHEAQAQRREEWERIKAAVKPRPIPAPHEMPGLLARWRAACLPLENKDGLGLMNPDAKSRLRGRDDRVFEDMLRAREKAIMRLAGKRAPKKVKLGTGEVKESGDHFAFIAAGQVGFLEACIRFDNASSLWLPSKIIDREAYFLWAGHNGAVPSYETAARSRRQAPPETGGLFWPGDEHGSIERDRRARESAALSVPSPAEALRGSLAYSWLPEHLREVLETFYVVGTWGGVAQAFGVSTKTAGRWVEKATAQLMSNINAFRHVDRESGVLDQFRASMDGSIAPHSPQAPREPVQQRH